LSASAKVSGGDQQDLFDGSLFETVERRANKIEATSIERAEPPEFRPEAKIAIAAARQEACVFEQGGALACCPAEVTLRPLAGAESTQAELFLAWPDTSGNPVVSAVLPTVQSPSLIGADDGESPVG
jgi:hypothetical protein